MASTKSAPYAFTSGPYSNQGSAPVHYSSAASSSSDFTMSSQADRHYYAANSPSPSTTNLLPPSATRGSGQGVQATFAKGPTLRSMASNGSLNESSPYTGIGGGMSKTSSLAPSISDKFSLSPDPSSWGADLSPNHPEPDDFLHNPDPRRDRKNDQGGTIFTSRGFTNLGCLAILCISLVTLFAGYPLITYFTKHSLKTFGGFNLGGINASGQVPSMAGNWGLIDLDTPQEAYTHPSYADPTQEMQLVFSDEFNVDGRTFYPGDDPYWEAVDLHYWQTNNMEWYSPDAITTKGGALKITLSKTETHGLDYRGGMMSTWNKFCFTGGMIVTAVTLPGINNIVGLWPAVWTMGNLGRAGFGASLEGMWPYTYDACDVGTAPNQTHNGLPIAATVGGDKSYDGVLSYLPGQRLSRCTCPGESHPGPVHSDGTYVGRAAPEIDIFEAQISGDPKQGFVSQSAQWGPFNAQYEWFNTSDNLIIPDPTATELNSYTGGVYQQASSGVTKTEQDCYELGTGCFSVYGFEYKPGFDNSYIAWIAADKLAWQLNGAGMAADSRVEISARPVPQEPLYIIANLGMSTNFGDVDLDHLTFPTTMSIDYIRVYQPKNAINIGCDPEDFPTQAYINQYLRAYTDANLTTWRDDFKQPFPKSSFLGQC
ncbi:beta-glucan synthesis-associated [Gloeophyllum trabeum ATCC 11539]|uniref:Beta-glucan synthesis-associated n=1 Tax=Gloeophyllum trabeum (strain ATCC 11539 / FP-39264 / Madison 617) TaxID=670483 RepID=S7QLT9_GLOTA|nr:beta-glucan synthesis-associated [Gloeophyllum trabeum ATCC 11539]EPQ60516.1 beta-glucan synthesis-associated [Gloeophyllum trabeum ATCC 11539]